jgi:hypothetical protein
VDPFTSTTVETYLNGPRGTGSPIGSTVVTGSGTYTATFSVNLLAPGTNTAYVYLTTTGCPEVLRTLTLAAGAPFSAPTNLTVVSTTITSVTLAWTPPTDGDTLFYRVYLSTGSGFCRVEEQGCEGVVSPTSAPSATVAGLRPGVAYSFYVTAVAASGSESLPSNTVTATLGATVFDPFN